MYEFTDKNIRAEFKKTEYGKKLNTWLKISLFITIVLATAAFVVTYLIFIKKIVVEERLVRLNIHLAEAAIVFISSVITCYFDGKRDGAIKQYMLNSKKDKKKTK